MSVSTAGSRASGATFGHTPVPTRAGVGLRHSHVDEFLARPALTGWLEIHTENYLGGGGPRLRALDAIRAHYPLSCHGVGLSLGSAEGLDAEALAQRVALIDRLQPGLVSEHLAWCVEDGAYLNDLLPLPYTEETLTVVATNIDRFQSAVRREILIENPSTYVGFAESTIPEPEFLAELSRRTGCGLLLDVNNVHVTGHNAGLNAVAWIDALLDRVPPERIGEIHIAGHLVAQLDAETVLIDDHGDVVSAAVWALLDRTLARLGRRPILVEWDTRIPALDILLAEAAKAERLLARFGGAHHVAA
jgi:uncharacterized protein